LNLQRAYWDIVVEQTIARIRAGKTPNPDILCNQYVKFGAFLQQIGSDWDYVATGHYARVTHDGGMSRLYRAPDPVKDQTYFLARLSQQQLAKALFPIGDYTKAQVREYARAYEVANALRKDSQGICFLGKLSFSDFIRHHLGTLPGSLIEAETGKEVGTHEGYWFYTLGQRHGIGLAGGPWYVVSKDIARNQVIISRQYYGLHHDRSRFWLEDLQWIAQERSGAISCQIKLRHGPHLAEGTVTYSGDGVHVQLADRDQGIAPGQYAVLYDGQECIGSGIISGERDA
jgi:tRNA-specific 2-thiouridylase